jgi:hypothetical protein
MLIIGQTGLKSFADFGVTVYEGKEVIVTSVKEATYELAGLENPAILARKKVQISHHF